jgi:hypothetical protein
MELGTEFDQFSDHGRHQRHPPFVRLRFLENGNVNVHEALRSVADGNCWPGLPGGLASTNEERRVGGIPYRLSASAGADAAASIEAA